jgi:hypothetical protein
MFLLKSAAQYALQPVPDNSFTGGFPNNESYPGECMSTVRKGELHMQTIPAYAFSIFENIFKHALLVQPLVL